jgi:hypothetical protein
MKTRHGPVYEITFFVAEDVIVEHEVWLTGKVRDAQLVEGVQDCQLFSIADDLSGRKGRVCQFTLENNDVLDEFIDGHGADIAAEAATRFGEQSSTDDRVLREDKSRELSSSETEECLNCGAHLRGQYCGHCGQRSRSRLISLWELVTDAFGDLFELDSRLWNTLVPLLMRPGLLTHDYLQGRRARYMPPFRMYLVLSLLFFLVAFFDPQEKLGLLFEPGPATPADLLEDGESGERRSNAQEIRQEVLEELASEGIVLGGDASPRNPDAGGNSLDITFEDETDDDCNIDQSDLDDLPAWVARRLTIERLQRVCERTQLDNGRALLDNLLENVPAALIILLPLMALVLKGLYPLSRRYYVEHLLFFVHFHAFFFLILSLQILFSRLMALLGVPDTPTVLALVASSFYIPVYLFVSMRTVYGQGRAITLFKYIMLTFAYSSGFIATMLGALAIAAFSI